MGSTVWSAVILQLDGEEVRHFLFRGHQLLHVDKQECVFGVPTIHIGLNIKSDSLILSTLYKIHYKETLIA
ncbi:hypothetical protein J6590_060781 [Homalodisca vitripennis]|nr:hypothetical protein J6590_060781 [Homalodisca vitripennis]